MLTKEAFNALLKTLEEPPSNVKFFFATTEPHKVLPTITSRCQRFDLHRLSPEQIIEKLEKIATDLGATVDKEALQLIGTMAEGGLRDAESLLDQLLCYTQGPLTYAEASQMLGISPRSFYFRLDQAIDSYNLSFGFELAHEVFSSGKDITAFLDGLIEHYRTLLLIKLQLPPATYLPDKEQKEYIRSAALYTQDQCLYLLDYLMHWYKEIHKTPFKRITLEMIFLHLIRSKKRISAPELVRRLEELDLSHQPKEPFAKITDSEKSNILNAIAKEKQSLLDTPTVRNVANSSKETTLKQRACKEITSQFGLCETKPNRSECNSRPKEEHHSQIGKADEGTKRSSGPLSCESGERSELARRDEEDRLGEVAASPNWEVISLQAQNPNPVSTIPVQPQMPEIATEKPTVMKAPIIDPSTSFAQDREIKVSKEESRTTTAQSSQFSSKQSTSKYDTLMRFAAVELEGLIKKE